MTSYNWFVLIARTLYNIMHKPGLGMTNIQVSYSNILLQDHTDYLATVKWLFQQNIGVDTYVLVCWHISLEYVFLFMCLQKQIRHSFSIIVKWVWWVLCTFHPSHDEFYVSHDQFCISHDEMLRLWTAIEPLTFSLNWLTVYVHEGSHW